MNDELEKKETGILKAGMAVVFSHGEYSDYQFGQVYICTQDFNYIEEAKKFYFEDAERQWNENKNHWFYVDWLDFESYLIRKGLLALCDYSEVHTGDYGFFDSDEWEEEFEKMKKEVKDERNDRN